MLLKCKLPSKSSVFFYGQLNEHNARGPLARTQ
uniref:Uncharacterized protein n=1 Tax=Anguilla anguilla TaxID=7936 RepID=A0A0E9T9A9_ANGAN